MTAPGGESVAPWARLAPHQPLARVVGDDTHGATVMRVTLPSVTRSASLARTLVATLLDGRDVDVDSRNDLVLAVSEASSNAIEYGTGRHVDLCVEVDRDGCLVSVSNAVDEPAAIENDAMAFAQAAACGATMPPAVAMRGRGIAIIDSVMDQVAIELVGQRCIVEMYRRLGD
jgi:anti-sigma regulatory factor (Ser/Thr protein kinase)